MMDKGRRIVTVVGGVAVVALFGGLLGSGHYRLVLALALPLVGGGGLYLLGRGCWGLWSPVRERFGQDPWQRLVGLVVACLFFHRALLDFGKPLVAAAFALLFRLPVKLLNGELDAPGRAGEGGLAAELVNGLDLVSNVASDASKGFGGFLALLATWVLIGWFLSAEGGMARIAQASPTMRRGLALTGLLLLGGSLSLASIIAIPLVDQVPPDSKVSEDELVKRLEAGGSMSQLTEASQSEDPLQGVEEALVAKKSQPLTLEQRESLEFVHRRLNQMRGARESLMGEWRRLKEMAEQDEKSRRDRALSLFNGSLLEHPGSPTTRKHFMLLLTWHQDSRQDWERRLLRCRESVREFDRVLRVKAQAMMRSEEHLQGSGFVDCSEPAYRPPPPRPAPGESIGFPFSVIVGWLVNTESMPLVLICGMLGFGLFGSAISRFVRTPPEEVQNPRALLNNLWHVVLSGASAAVVVFLAAHGGLAVFSGAEASPQPKPYVLLLTCFVASVFSEYVWEWARGRLQQGLSESPASAEGRGGTPEESQSLVHLPQPSPPEVQAPSKGVATP